MYHGLIQVRSAEYISKGDLMKKYILTKDSLSSFSAAKNKESLLREIELYYLIELKDNRYVSETIAVKAIRNCFKGEK